MKILIGTPIHELKDYCMERWVENVSHLKHPVDILLVDSSPGLDYVEKVKGYLKKHGLENCKISHFEIYQNQPDYEKISRSREIIRQYILSHDYDVWFSWECDYIIPYNALDKLAKIIESGNYSIVHASPWTREIPIETEATFGVCLIRRWCLEKFGFLVEYPGMPTSWPAIEPWFKKQVLDAQGSCIETFGLIKPIKHLINPNQ